MPTLSETPMANLRSDWPTLGSSPLSLMPLLHMSQAAPARCYDLSVTEGRCGACAKDTEQVFMHGLHIQNYALIASSWESVYRLLHLAPGMSTSSQD